MHCLYTATLMLYCTSLSAQTVSDSLHQLKEVTILGEKDKTFFTGLATDTIDTRILNVKSSSNVADILSATGKLFVKSYGPGTLSSLSLNGTNATQTNVVWNGLRIESPMLGQTDPALLPSCLTDAIIIQSGGRGDVLGSGSMAGTVQLLNRAHDDSVIGITFHEG